jgi:hypothetical protein
MAMQFEAAVEKATEVIIRTHLGACYAWRGSLAVLMSLASVMAVGCAESVEETSGPASAASYGAAAASIPPELRDAKFALDPVGSSAVGPALLEELRSALYESGFHLVDASGGPDFQLHLSVLEQEQPSMFQVTVNGKRRVDYTIRASVSVLKNGSSVDSATTTFTSHNGEVNRAHARPLVDGLARSTVMVAAMRDRAKAASEWETLLTECRSPTSATSCDRLRAWALPFESVDPRPNRFGAPPPPVARKSAEGPDKQKLEQAHEVLRLSESKIRELRADEAWRKLDLQRCKTASTDDDCADVNTFLGKFNSTAHADEGHALLNAVRERMREKRDAEAKSAAEKAEKEEKVEAARAHKQAKDAQCQSSCVAFTDPGKKAQCIAQCR